MNLKHIVRIKIHQNYHKINKLKDWTKTPRRIKGDLENRGVDGY